MSVDNPYDKGVGMKVVALWGLKDDGCGSSASGEWGSAGGGDREFVSVKEGVQGVSLGGVGRICVNGAGK